MVQCPSASTDTYAGAVYVTPSDLSGDVQTGGPVFVGATYDYASSSDCAGDLDADGRDDIVIGGHQQFTGAGVVYVLYGSSI